MSLQTLRKSLPLRRRPAFNSSPLASAAFPSTRAATGAQRFGVSAGPRPRRLRRFAPLVLGCLLLVGPVRAGEERGQEEERLQLALNFDAYDFEPRGDDPASRDRDGDGWPDYWEPAKDSVAYLHDRIRIVEDPERPGLWRGQPGHVLKVPFDGTRVAVQTRVPKLIDSDLAYEISVWGRMEGITGSIARVVLVWLHQDEATGEKELDRDQIVLPPGQLDWPEHPLTLRINDLPLEANRVRVVCEVVDDPTIPGADRHATVWFDDIRLESRPKIRIPPVFATVRETPDGGLILPPLSISLTYLGLIDNLPDPARPGHFKGKSYFRAIEITDMFDHPPADDAGRPLTLLSQPRMELNPGLSRTFREDLVLRLPRLGVYYLTIKLFTSQGDILARVEQVVGLQRPPSEDRGPTRGALEKGLTFGLLLDTPPEAVLRAPRLLADLVDASGVQQIKVHLWSRDFKPQGTQPYLVALNRELRLIRARGARITAAVTDSPSAFRDLGMRKVMQERTDLLSQHLSTAVNLAGPNVEYWQWGADDDPSFAEGVGRSEAETAIKTLEGLAGVAVQAFPLPLSAPRLKLPSPAVAQAVSLRVPALMSEKGLAASIAGLLPLRLAYLTRPDIYPPRSLSSLLPPELATMDEATLAIEEEKTPRETWLSLELSTVPRHGRSAVAERAQVTSLARKAILARALGVSRIYLGELFGADSGLMALDKQEHAIPRPAYLAARVLEEQLGGAAYLGSFQLREHFPNYVFRHRNGRDAVIAFWYDGPEESAPLDLGGGVDMTVIDLAGNRRLVHDKSVIALQVPQFVLGMSVPLARTRMSVRIRETPPLMSRRALQTQLVSITNYFDQQLPGQLRFTYATDNAFHLERNWTVRPQKLSFNLASGETGELATGFLEYEVQPDLNTETGGEAARKYVQLVVDFNIATPVRFRLLRETEVRSDLEVVIKPLQSAGPETARIATLLMQVRWFPQQASERRGSVELTPYYKLRSDLKVPLPKITVPVYTEKTKSAPAVPVKFEIPRGAPGTRAWVGLDEESGDRFFRQEVTALMAQTLAGGGNQ